MQDADGEQQTFWYYQLERQVVGPVMAVRLCQMARQGKIRASDKVRKGPYGDWVDAGTVEMLEIVQSVQQPLVPIPTLPVPVVVRETRWSIGSRLRDLYDILLERLSDGGRFLLRLVFAVVPPVVVVGLLTVAVMITRNFISKLDIDWSAPPDPLAIYNAVWKEFEQKRKDQVSDKVWDEFEERSRQEIVVAVAWLEKHARSTDPESQILLRAGRDCLPIVLKDARKRPTRTEWFFRDHLKSIDQLRKGKPLNQRNDRFNVVTDQLRASINMEMVGLIAFILFDFLIVGWVIRFWLRKHMERKGLHAA